LGFALAKLQELEPGIYVCMNGKVFGAKESGKIIQQGRFVSLFGENK